MDNSTNTTAQATLGSCAMCDSSGTTYIMPLHGEKGGPLCCPFCLGKWHAEHGRKRRAGRVVIRAINAFLDAGGNWGDIKKLQYAYLGFDELGYMAGLSMQKNECVDLTSELLAAVLQLTHPDHHPIERKEAATKVTAELLKLKPFVFPAPKPKPEPPPQTQPSKKDDGLSKLVSKLNQYPCSDCKDTVPRYYCTTCKTEWDKRRKQEKDRRIAKQRAVYARRRKRIVAMRKPKHCESCGKEFESKRTDARFCSPRCRQAIHRKVVTDKSQVRAPDCLAVTESVALKRQVSGSRLSICDARNLILAALRLHDAVFLNDILPPNRTKGQYQALCKAARQLEDAAEIGSRGWCFRWNQPGFIALKRRYFEIKDSDKVVRLTPEQRLAIQIEADKAKQRITDKQHDTPVTELSVIDVAT